MSQRVYISGPITGVEGYMKNFEGVEDYLEDHGYVVINPAKVNAQMPEGTSYETYMNMSLDMLASADAIYLMPGWANSKGCNREYGFALGANIEVIKGWMLK